jgi:riboflavin-specific deaminase-like protein
MSPRRKTRHSKIKTRDSMPVTRNPSPGTRNSKLPFVFSNFAMTADGKIAFADHRFAPFTSRRDLEHMMELRTTADAVMSGARTVDLSPATLGTGGAKYRRQRVQHGLREYNLRIIVSGSGTVDPDAKIFAARRAGRDRHSPIIVLTTGRMAAASRRRLQALVDEVRICGRRRLDFRAAFQWLRRKWGVKRLLCEGGGELHGALIEAGLLNELHLTLSPRIFGGRTAPTIADGAGFEKLASAARLKLKSARRTVDELFLVFSIR